MSNRNIPAEGQVTPAGRLEEGLLRTVFGYQLAQATVLTDQVFRERISGPFGLRKVEFTVLSLVGQNEGLTATKLASALAFTAPNTAAWVERLESRDLVKRQQHSQDRRAFHIHTTAAGRDLLQRATEAILAGEAQALLKLTPGERLMLSELLHKAASGRPFKR